MNTTKRVFGHLPDGREVYIFTLKNKNGISAEITNYGGIVTSLNVPDRDGVTADIVLGFDSLEEYLDDHPYFGALVGRYANRIAGARFELDGEVYHLAANNGNNHLHGGVDAIDKKVWDYDIPAYDDGTSLRLTLFSPDGDEGYPGNLSLEVLFTLNNSDELKINYKATTDKATPVNISHHGYFNLTGGRESVLGHMLKINANRFTGVDDELIPTGELPLVEGTAMDFREMKTVGRDIENVQGGYDHNYVLEGTEGSMRTAAVLYEPDSGRRMEVITTQPGVQLYTGNFLDGSLTGKGGAVYEKYWGLCLETQHFPDSPNQPSFPSAILRPGEEYHHTVVFRFGTE
ncbi:MAG: aldose epimerase family protein [Bacteroidales bacterium]